MISVEVSLLLFIFFFKQKTAYEMRISDWSSDVCSSDLPEIDHRNRAGSRLREFRQFFNGVQKTYRHEPGSIPKAEWVIICSMRPRSVGARHYCRGIRS